MSHIQDMRLYMNTSAHVCNFPVSATVRASVDTKQPVLRVKMAKRVEMFKLVKTRNETECPSIQNVHPGQKVQRDKTSIQLKRPAHGILTLGCCFSLNTDVDSVTTSHSSSATIVKGR